MTPSDGGSMETSEGEGKNARNEPDGDQESVFLGFLQEEYTLKVGFLNAHFSRMWTRFNFLLTIELALFGFFGFLVFDPRGKDLRAALIPIVLGLITSLVWWVLGSEDRYLVSSYRRDVAGARAIIVANVPELEPYSEFYVGSRKGAPEGYLDAADRRGLVTRLVDLVFSWYLEPISITRLAAILPVVFLILWLVVLYLRLKQVFIFGDL